MNDRSADLPERNLGDLLNETFNIFGSHFWALVSLASIIGVPLSFLALIPVDGLLRFFGIMYASMLLSIPAIAALIYAVGQHYVLGQINVRNCYSRVMWRAVSVASIGIVLTVALSAGILLVFLVIPALVVLGYLIYWSMALQVAIIEGQRFKGALKRSQTLIRNSWLRVAGIWGVLILVVVGLALLINFPFFLVFVALDKLGWAIITPALQILASAIVLTVVPTVVAIASTLMYYDLRVRNEDYDIGALSEEMGLATT